MFGSGRSKVLGACQIRPERTSNSVGSEGQGHKCLRLRTPLAGPLGSEAGDDLSPGAAKARGEPPSAGEVVAAHIAARARDDLEAGGARGGEADRAVLEGKGRLACNAEDDVDLFAKLEADLEAA